MKKIVTSIVLCFVVLACAKTTHKINKAKDESQWQTLFDGSSLNGWQQINGSAKFTIENGELVGTSVNEKVNSFLAVEQEYDDFILEFDAKIDNTLNSGVQFRSLTRDSRPNGTVYGYQLELDPSGRNWSGGIYDEGRRLWLYPLSRNDAARNTYKAKQWNSYRIEAIGNNLRTYINGLPAANVVDNATTKGLIALQVHATHGKAHKIGQKVRWKNIRIKTENLEQSRWLSANNIEEYNYIPNHLTARQKTEGWQLLWDGSTTKGWRGAKLDAFPNNGWKINNGLLSVVASGGAESRNGGDIVSQQEFSNFELEVDFKITEGANSGIKYFVDPDLLQGEGSAIGLEFQILDDKKHPDAKAGVAGNRTIGSLYDLITAGNLSETKRQTKRFNGIGKWNRARIVVKGGHVEHWLNGVKTVEFDRHSQIFKALVAYSKYARWPNFGAWKKGPILLQDHGDQVHFRSIKIKDFDKA